MASPYSLSLSLSVVYLFSLALSSHVLSPVLSLAVSFFISLSMCGCIYVSARVLCICVFFARSLFRPMITLITIITQDVPTSGMMCHPGRHVDVTSNQTNLKGFHMAGTGHFNFDLVRRMCLVNIEGMYFWVCMLSSRI